MCAKLANMLGMKMTLPSSTRAHLGEDGAHLGLLGSLLLPHGAPDEDCLGHQGHGHRAWVMGPGAARVENEGKGCLIVYRDMGGRS